ncbi:biotin holocarboxylase synthetase [Blastocladiella emersonii ATCC 22665]|nr:biotin holocarboxylase synthetase [Blastocladiella emersonii ATCC 22665]
MASNLSQQQPQRPAASKLNVLLYTGAGATPTPIQQTWAALRSMLGGRYDVVKVDAAALTAEPWEPTTALLVMPGGRDIPFTQHLGVTGAARIREYVRRGGRYLGLCAGAYYASSAIEFEVRDPVLKVAGPRPLALFPGVARGAVYPGFQYDSEDGARATTVALEGPAAPADALPVYFNGGCYFDEASLAKEHHADVTVLARYTEPSPAVPEGSPNTGLPAVIECRVGDGRAVLSGVHFEYSPSLLAAHPNTDLVQALHLAEPTRLRVLAWLLGDRLGLDLVTPQIPWAPAPDATNPHMPIHFLSLDRPALVTNLAATQRRALPGSTGDAWVVQDEHDGFAFHLGPLPSPTASPTTAVPRVDPRPSANGDEYTWPVIVLPDATAQPAADHAFFHLAQFQDALATRRAAHRYVAWLVGTHLAYTRVITSTQTVLDKNPAFLAAVPTGTVLMGYHQTTGRGRGRNAWISPPGCLQFSFVVRTSMREPGTPDAPYIPPAAAVHVQYLMALAVTRAKCLQPANLRVKWPNDIYAASPTGGESAAPIKVGGILVTSSIFDSKFTLVVGCGINIDNAAPTTSVNALLSAAGAPRVTLEAALADILVAFDLVWQEFVQSGGFSPSLRNAYLGAWLHSGQEVTLAEHAGRRARIVGIDDNGYLRTVAVDDPAAVFVLQPDGNSFDMMRGLISRKV